MKMKMKLFCFITLMFLVIGAFVKNYLFIDDFIESKSSGEQENIMTEANSYITENYQSFLTEEGAIDIVDSNYMVALTEVFYNLDKYQGREIALEGFVHREVYYDDNQFMLARSVVSCCAEHATMMGLLSHWEDAEELKEGTWISVKGMLQSTVHYSSKIDKEATWPMVIVEELEIIEKPEEEYIYHEL